MFACLIIFKRVQVYQTRTYSQSKVNKKMFVSTLMAALAVAFAAAPIVVAQEIQPAAVKEGDNKVDVTSLMIQRIEFIQDYLDNPIQHLNKISLLGSDDDVDDDEIIDTTNMDIIHVLDYLEGYFISESTTREFYNLGGWPLLASLVSKTVHSDKHNSISNSDNDNNVSMQDKILFIRAYAAMAIGTAIKSRDKFRHWVLEEQVVVMGGDDSTSILMAKTTTPLYLVTQALVEVSDAAQTPGSCSQLTLQYKEQLAWKTMEALEAFLLGNPRALAAFATMTVEKNENANSISTNTNPAQVLGLQAARWVQEAVIAAADEQTSNAHMSRHAIKMTNSLLALANDVIRDVAQDDNNNNNQHQMIIQAFTTNEWCHAVMQAATMSTASKFKRLVFAPLQRTALLAVSTLGPHCVNYYKDDGKRLLAKLIHLQQQLHLASVNELATTTTTTKATTAATKHAKQDMERMQQLVDQALAAVAEAIAFNHDKNDKELIMADLTRLDQHHQQLLHLENKQQEEARTSTTHNQQQQQQQQSLSVNDKQSVYDLRAYKKETAVSRRTRSVVAVPRDI